MGGKLRAFEGHGDHVRVSWRPRGADALRAMDVRRVVNCSGPLGDLLRTEEPLLRRLIARGMIRPDANRVGIDVNQQAEVIGADGRANPRLLALEADDARLLLGDRGRARYPRADMGGGAPPPTPIGWAAKGSRRATERPLHRHHRAGAGRAGHRAAIVGHLAAIVDQQLQQALAGPPVAEIGGGVDMAPPGRCSRNRRAMRRPSRAPSRSGHRDRSRSPRRWPGRAAPCAHGRETGDAGIEIRPADIRRRDQQRTPHPADHVRCRGTSSTRRRQGTQAVRGQDHRPARGGHRLLDIADPDIAVGLFPAAELHALAIMARALPHALPVRRSGIAEPRYRQTERSTVQFIVEHGSPRRPVSIPHLMARKKPGSSHARHLSALRGRSSCR